jgi:hypothetical protein
LSELADKAREFFAELREHWDDSYWWADHPALRVLLLSLIAAAVELSRRYLELRLARAMEAA